MIVKAFWPVTPKPGNMGDILNPYILGQCGHKVVHVSYDTDGKILCVGSIIRMTRPNDIVWGAGAIISKDKINPTAEYRAVRGPLTRDIILEQNGICPTIYGDPALLMPRFYKPRIDKEYDIGIVPHYVDYNIAVKKYPDQHIIDIIHENPLSVIDEICRCERILSSSLHGIIIAHAYGIPAIWIKLSGKLYGDDIKFRDYFLSIGQKPYNPMYKPAINNKIKIPKVDLNIDLNKLWEVRP